MSKRKHAQNLETYSFWKKDEQKIDPVVEARFKEKAAEGSKKTVYKVIGISLVVVLLASTITQLIAMSQYSTLGYEIELMQEQKARLTEEADQLRTAIAEYQTTKYYQQKAAQATMVKPAKMIYLQIDGTYSDSKSADADSRTSTDSSACTLADR